MYDLLDGKVEEVIDGVESIDAKLQLLSEKLNKVFQLTKNSKIPLGLKRMIGEAFSCKICHSVMSPPIIVGLCCKSVLGCEKCVNLWYATAQREDVLTKACPACRGERGYSQTVRIHGLDELLQGIQADTLLTHILAPPTQH